MINDDKAVHVIVTIFFGILFFVSTYQVTMSGSTSFADDPDIVMWSICAIVSGIFFLIDLISPSIDDHYL